MAFGEVNIEVGQGLGALIELNDGIAGMVVSGAAIADPVWSVGDTKQFFSLDQVKAAGLNEAYDTANNTNAYSQCLEFYNAAGNGAELWVLIAPPTESMEDIADPNSTNHYARKLVEDSDNAIRLLGITRVPTVEEGNAVNGYDDDAAAAIPKATLLRTYFEGKQTPFRVFIEGRNYGGVPADLTNNAEKTDSSVAVVLCSSQEAVVDSTHNKSAAVGLCLGSYAALPVQRKIARVKNGTIKGVTQAYFSDGTAVKNEDAKTIAGKGYIVMRTWEKKADFYWANDNTCVAETNDYSLVPRGRVMDKVWIITYLTYVEEVDDDVELNVDGTLDAGIVKDLEQQVENQIGGAMIDEISSVNAYIDASQPVGTTNTLNIEVSIVPKGYLNEINVKLAFSFEA